MRCLVTGASGFVGNNLVRRLIRDGHTIHVLLLQDYEAWRMQDILQDVCIHTIDLSEARLARVVQEIKPDWIFHLAAHGAYSSQTDLNRMVQTNIVGTINLVEACLQTGFQAFVNTGSSSEYGFKDHAPSETEWLEPNSNYAVTKASATLFCRYTAQSLGVHMPTLRLYSVFGPFEDPARFIPILIVRGFHGELPPLVNPAVARDYIYVDDVVDAYLLAASKSGSELGAVWNVGTGVQTSLSEVVNIARRVMGISSEPIWGSMADRQWDTNIWLADNRKICRELGWQPRQTFEQGFCLMVNWFRNNPDILRFFDQPLA